MRYRLPKDTTAQRILVSRKKISKSCIEKGIDFLFTFGNERYEEHYFILIKRDNGQHFIEERIYYNEVTFSSDKQLTLFDRRDNILIGIKMIDWIISNNFKKEDG